MPISTHRLAGTETEPAVIVPQAYGKGSVPPSQWLNRVIVEGIPHLPFADGTGVVLPSGSSAGHDHDQPEHRTVECLTTRALVLAHCGLRDWSMLRLRACTEQYPELCGAEISYGAASYATKATYGTHVNLDCTIEMPAMERIIGHLFVMSLPLTGSGALVFGTPAPCWTAHLEARELSSLFTFKKSYKRGCKRLQIACSTGANRSQWSLALGFGTLRLIVEAIERGAIDASFPLFTDVRTAARTVNRDMTLRKEIPTTHGSMCTLELLERLFERFALVAESDDDIETCARVQYAIQLYNDGMHGLATTHDPCILYAQLIELAQAKADLDEDQFRNLCDAALIAAEREACTAFDTDPDETLLRRARIVDVLRNARGRRDSNTPSLKLASHIRIPAEELYMKWSVLGTGIFDEFEAAGLLRHLVPGWGLGDSTQLIPPDLPARARARGMFVLKHAAEAARYAVGWAIIHDKQTGARLIMDDPFTATDEWTAPAPQAAPTVPPADRHAMQPIVQLYLPTLSAMATEPAASAPFEFTEEETQPSGAVEDRLPVFVPAYDAATARNAEDPLFDDALDDASEHSWLPMCVDSAGRAESLAEYLYDHNTLRRNEAGRGLEAVANEYARGLRKLIAFDAAYGGGVARRKFAMTLFAGFIPVLLKFFDSRGALRAWVWPVYRVLGHATARQLLDVVARAIRNTTSLQTWGSPSEIGACAAVQFALELGYSDWALEICAAARARHNLSGSWQLDIRESRGLLESGLGKSGSESETQLRACIVMARKARFGAPVNSIDQTRAQAIETRARMALIQSGLQEGGEVALNALADALPESDDLAATVYAMECGRVARRPDLLRRHACRASELEPFEAGAQAVLVAEGSSDPRSPQYMPLVDEHHRRWAAWVAQARSPENDTLYLNWLLQQGAVVEAFHVAPDTARQLAPDVEQRCAGARQPDSSLTFPISRHQLTTQVHVCHLPSLQFPWTVGVPQIGLFGMGSSMSAALEYLSVRIRSAGQDAKRGALREVRGGLLRDLAGWIVGHSQRGSVDRRPSESMRDAYTHYRKSHYGVAMRNLLRAAPGVLQFGATERRNFRRFSAFTTARLGVPIADAYGEEHLREELRYAGADDMFCSDVLCTRRYRGLKPSLDRDTYEWFKRGVQLRHAADRSVGPLLYLYWGSIVLANHPAELARPLLEHGLALEWEGQAEVRVVSLLLCALAEVDRLQGNYELAREVLQHVNGRQLEHELYGDIADFTLPGLAKLDTDHGRRTQILGEARQYARRAGQRKAFVRAIMIEARTATMAFERQMLRHEFEEARDGVLDLVACPITSYVDVNWESWCGQAPEPWIDFMGL